MNNYAPVLIATLNRFEHFRRCVESLFACTDADKTDLYIALDYPLKDSHWNGYKKIENYIEKIQGFRSVNIIKRNINFGVAKNYFDAQAQIFENHDRIIISEDDNEFSPNFLDYINQGLDKFEKHSNVLAVCGHNFPIEISTDYRQNYYYGKAFSGWGYGIWKDRYEKIKSCFQNDMVQIKLKNTREIFKLFKYRIRNVNSLLQIAKTGIMLGDVVLSAFLIERNTYCVFPTISKVRNHGHDGSGVNCKTINGKNIYSSQVIDVGDLYVFSDLPNEAATKLINMCVDKYFKTKFRFKFLTFVKYILYRISGYVFFG